MKDDPTFTPLSLQIPSLIHFPSMIYKLLDAFVMKYAERVNQVHKQMLPKKVDLSETYVVFTKYFSSVRNK